MITIPLSVIPIINPRKDWSRKRASFSGWTFRFFRGVCSPEWRISAPDKSLSAHPHRRTLSPCSCASPDYTLLGWLTIYNFLFAFLPVRTVNIDSVTNREKFAHRGYIDSISKKVSWFVYLYDL